MIDEDYDVLNTDQDAPEDNTEKHIELVELNQNEAQQNGIIDDIEL